MSAKRVYECDFCDETDAVGINSFSKKILYFPVFTNDRILLEAYVCKGCQVTFKEDLEAWHNMRKLAAKGIDNDN